MIGHPLKVRELLDEVTRGAVLLPEIQRAYVWKGPQVARLLDSLYHQYPAGQILLWDTINLPITKQLQGAIAPALPSAGSPKIVLDGQQRVTSLFKALGETEDRVNVYFHLEKEQFERYSRKMMKDPRWIPTRDVIQGKLGELALLGKVAEAGGPSLTDPKSQVYLERLQRLRGIGEYKFPIEIFRSEDYEEVTELFVRINSAGTRLRAAELILAQLALKLPGALVNDFEDALDDYSELGFELDARFLIRTLIAVGTGQSRFRYLTEFWKRQPEEVQGIWVRAKKGIDSAVNFVRHNARFESADWLPSINALIPLTAFFVRNSSLTPGVEKQLLRWFYIASLRGRYSGSAETSMDEDLKAVMADTPIEALLKNALPAGAPILVEPDEFDDAGWRNPLFPLSYAMARKRGAKDWFTGVALSRDVAGADHEIQIHHVFPKAQLKKLGVGRTDRDEIANLAFLSARPNKQISSREPVEYLAQIAKAEPARLEAQCVPLDPSLWALDRFQDFLAARRKLLAEGINHLLSDPT